MHRILFVPDQKDLYGIEQYPEAENRPMKNQMLWQMVIWIKIIGQVK